MTKRYGTLDETSALIPRPNSVNANASKRRQNYIVSSGIFALSIISIGTAYGLYAKSDDRTIRNSIIGSASALSYGIIRFILAPLSIYVPDLLNIRHLRDNGCGKQTATPFTEENYNRRIIRRTILVSEAFAYFVATAAVGMLFGIRAIQDKADADKAILYIIGTAVGGSIFIGIMFFMAFGHYFGLSDCIKVKEFIHYLSEHEHAELNSDVEAGMSLQIFNPSLNADSEYKRDASDHDLEQAIQASLRPKTPNEIFSRSDLEAAIKASLLSPSGEDALANSESYKRLQRIATENDWNFIDVKGDGNCFFRAVAHSLKFQPIDQEYDHKEIRIRAVSYLKAHRNEFPGFYVRYEDKRDRKSYIKTMSQDATWADDLIVAATAKALGIDIEIYSGASNACTRIQAKEDNQSAITIRLGNIDEQHYVCLLNGPAPSAASARAQNSLLLAASPNSTDSEDENAPHI